MDSDKQAGQEDATETNNENTADVVEEKVPEKVSEITCLPLLAAIKLVQGD